MIITEDGHGIILYSTADGTAATNATITGTTVTADGTGKHGIAGSDGSHSAIDVIVMNCNVRSTQGHTITAGKNWSVTPGNLLHTGTQ